MVKLARELIEKERSGDRQRKCKVSAGMADLMRSARSSDDNQAVCMEDGPEKSGISNCVGDIGTHIEDTVAYYDRHASRRVAAVLDNYGMELELNANILWNMKTAPMAYTVVPRYVQGI